MIVIFSEEAKVDLEGISTTIAEDSPARALSFVRELRQRCEGLANMPHRFQLVPTYEHTGVRRHVFGNYLIFYHVGAEAVEILHILHGAMDYASHFFPES
jgi:plasmid stabilization system protein ParE